MSRVVLTGAAGFLGSHVVRHSLEDPCEDGTPRFVRWFKEAHGRQA